EAIYAYLSSLPDLAAIVGDRIYPTHPDRGAEYPFLPFSIPRTRGIHGRGYGQNLGGPDGTSVAHVEITATGYLESDCVRAIRAVAGLQDFSGDLAGGAALRRHAETEADGAPPPPSGDDRWIHECNVAYMIKHR